MKDEKRRQMEKELKETMKKYGVSSKEIDYYLWFIKENILRR